MNTDINAIDSQYTSETICFDDAQLGTLISELDKALQHLDNIASELNQMVAYESSWQGKSKQTYLELKGFLTQYQTDYTKSVKKLKKTATGLESLLASIPSANVIREINNA